MLFRQEGEKKFLGGWQLCTVYHLVPSTALDFLTVTNGCGYDIWKSCLIWFEMWVNSVTTDLQQNHANLVIFSLLHKECFPVVPKLHMQSHWFSVDLHIHLEEQEMTKRATTFGFRSRSLVVPTTFSRDRRTPILPKRTWKGEHCREPSGCLTTMTSMQPERVAGLSPRYSSFTWTNTWPANWPT